VTSRCAAWPRPEAVSDVVAVMPLSPVRLVLRWGFRLLALVVALAVLYVGVTFGQVWWASNHDEAAPASAIVVMGAAQWNGRPSPVFQARLDHAAELWGDGFAPLVVVTGGKQAGDLVTQGRAGYDYLRELGLPDEAIRVEVGGTNSYEEISASAAIVRGEGVEPRVLIVSDPYHAYRVVAIADEVGLDASFSSADVPSSLENMARETAAVALGRVVGFRRLAAAT
jgi:uncharacterized SAM-binding protein YcdF (DUF218 family)